MFPGMDVEESNNDRTEIREFVISRYLGENVYHDNEPEFILNTDNNMGIESNLLDLDAKHNLGSTHEGVDDIESAPAFSDSDEDHETSEINTKLAANLVLYRNLILKSPEYQWLVATLKRELSLTRAQPDIMEDIRTKILSTLPPSHKVRRKKAPNEYEATFELDWDLVSFAKEQK